jgi:phosphatidylglycerol---prolipoprotein diacylglyceryl transferase
MTSTPSFPRFFRFGRYWINSYKVFLCIGIYSGILVSAAVGQRSGLSPLRLGVGLLLFALLGMFGARAYTLILQFGNYRRHELTLTPRDANEGGWGVLGGLIVVPVSLMFDSILGIPIGRFWDHMAVAIATGGVWIRFGCVCNGCCVGRDSDAWFAVQQHDVDLIRRRRIPAQWLEIAWWLLACAGLIWLWPKQLPFGSYAVAVLGWYGLGRLWLEPLRRHSTMLWGLRIDRVVAGVVAVVAAIILWQRL